MSYTLKLPGGRVWKEQGADDTDPAAVPSGSKRLPEIPYGTAEEYDLWRRTREAKEAAKLLEEEYREMVGQDWQPD